MIDNALSPALATELTVHGFDAVHVRDVGIQHATDEVIFDRAAAEQRIVVTADTDFGTILASRGTPRPSVVLWRRSEPRRAAPQARLLADVLQVGDAGCARDVREGWPSCPAHPRSGQQGRKGEDAAPRQVPRQVNGSLHSSNMLKRLRASYYERGGVRSQNPSDAAVRRFT